VTLRTLSECRFTTGYASAQHPRRPVPLSERIYGYLLAAGIAGGLAWYLIRWWAGS
jgi:hypothetical protein